MLCGGGVYASIDLALYIVEKLCGRDIAMGCAKSLVVQMPRTYQTSFAILPFGRDHGDALIRSSEDWLHNHFPDDIDLDSCPTIWRSRRALSFAASRRRPARRRSPTCSA